MDYLQQASDIHHQVEDQIKNIIEQPHSTDLTLLELRGIIEELITSKLDNLTNNTINSHHITNSGLAFPIGLSVDSIVAHYTPFKMPTSHTSTLPYYLNPYTTLKECKLLKVDYGVQINGYIIDSAFTLDFVNTPESSTIVKASNEIVDEIIKSCGVDVRLHELSDIANELVSSYEVNEKQLSLVSNVYSHNIEQWKIHGGKFISLDYKDAYTMVDYKMKLNEQYAIEFYATNGLGKGHLIDNTLTYSHYRLDETYYDTTRIPIFEIDKYNKIIDVISNNMKMLPFCPNFFASYNLKVNKKKLTPHNIASSLQELHCLGYLHSYPPIIETDPKALVAQNEKTILIDEIVKVF
jgi:methionyl aminopeptidase